MAASVTVNLGSWTLTESGVSVSFSSTGTVSVSRSGTSSTATVTVSQTVTHVSGDWCGLILYYKPSGGSWTKLKTVAAAQHTVGTTTALSGTYTVSVGDASGSLSGQVCVTAVASSVATDSAYKSYTVTYGAKTSYTITYNANGGSGTVSNQTKYYGTSLTLRSNGYTRTGYKFVKWNTAANGTGTSYNAGAAYTANAAATLYAIWSAEASTVSATAADIGAASTITVTRYNTAYYHSLAYSFEGLTGYITSAGATATSESKYTTTSISFTVPTTFYAKITDKKTGTCTITCKTYASSSATTELGTTTCTFQVTATGSPTVTLTVTDTNTVTKTLTGDASKLIKYRSTARASTTATPQNSAKLVSMAINGTSVLSGGTGTDAVTKTKDYANVTDSSFTASAADSRGYSTSKSVTPTMVEYIQLTMNVTVSRPSPTGNTLNIALSGDLFRGSFGAKTNALTLKYRSKAKGGSYGSYTTVSSITYGTNYYTKTLSVTGFAYNTEYTLEFVATDGVSGAVLTTVTKEVTVAKGIPVFDWGEDDFAFHVPVTIEDMQVGNAAGLTYNVVNEF